MDADDCIVKYSKKVGTFAKVTKWKGLTCAGLNLNSCEYGLRGVSELL